MTGPARDRSSTWSCPSTTRRPTWSRRSAACTRTCPPQFPYPFRITIADNASVDATPAIATRLAGAAPRGRVAADAGEGPRPGAAGRVDRVRRAGARLLRRGPVHRPRRAAAAGRPADHAATRTWRSAPGSPATPAWCAAPSASSSPARYNLILRGTLAARFSDAQCGFKAIRGDVAQRLRAAGRGHRLVLRHRAARARRARRAAHPRGAGGLGRRPRLVGRHRRAPPSTTSRASPGSAARSRPAASPCTTCARSSAAAHSRPRNGRWRACPAG